LGTSDAGMQGKVCLVTGATSGIGLATVRGLARRGARVLLVARNERKCTRVLRELKDETGNEELECFLANLSLKAEIEQLASKVHQATPKLDVLVNDAGAVYMRRRLNADGIERTFALNHLAYFHLTLRLLDLLRNADRGRIINLTSAMHATGELDFKNLQLEKGYGGLKAYRRSKLANLLFTYELARRLEGTMITVNAVHPGFVATNIGANNTSLYQLAKPFLRLIAKSPEEGAETVIYLAASPEVAGVTGAYFIDCEKVKSSPASYNEEDARRLWDRSLKLTGLKDRFELTGLARLQAGPG
jgi:NAD(P)-dependent dehydrogenase (short-subunit alcohol dehydrogenase family)